MIDLHTHSIYSDGSFTPTQVIDLAVEAGLSAVALTDHNTTAGLPEFLRAAEGKPIRAVPGVEFSTDYMGSELHILALLLPMDRCQQVEQRLQVMLQRKEESNRDLIAALRRADIHLDYDAIRAANPGVINRAVIAAEMTRLGYCETVPEAFERWLSPKHGYFQPPRRLDVFETIGFIRSLGAVPVLAHPFLNFKERAPLHQFLQQAVPAGLQGMETQYSKFTERSNMAALELAREFGLAESGGSDFHGENKPDIRIAVGRGELSIPDAFLTELELRRS